MKYRHLFLFLILPILLTYQNCAPMLANNDFASSTFDDSQFAQGKTLYDSNCASCHGGLESSAKRNKSSEEIYNAIVTIGAMSHLQSALNSSDIDTIAYALSDNNCTPDELLKPQLRRLTQQQYENTLESVFGEIFSESDFVDFQDSNPTIGLGNNPDTLALDSIQFERLYTATDRVIDRVLVNNATFSSCRNSGSNSCVNQIVDYFGLRAWRRPLRDTERADLLGALALVSNINGTNERPLRFVLKALLLSNNFLFRSEIGTVSGSERVLTPYEIASLLSYSFWNSAPDETLYQLAGQNALHDPLVIEQQMLRLRQSPRFSQAMNSFFTDYLKLENVLTVNKDSSLVNFSNNVRQTLMQSAQQSLSQTTSDPNAPFMQVFEGQNFYVNNTISSIFGLNSSSYGSSLTAVSLPTRERLGILSHPAFLASHSGANTSGIVKRGVFTLEQILCSPLGAPPDNISPVDVDSLPANFDPNDYSSRELIQITHSSQSQCMTCHQKIDPAGFGFENFDAFGQFRDVEKQNIPIDASGSIRGVAEADINFNDSTDYIDQLSRTETMKACVSDHYYQYVMGQKASASSCDKTNFTERLRFEGETIGSLPASLVELKSFTHRNLE